MTHWYRSSFCDSSQCVEVTVMNKWERSSFCEANQCVEVDIRYDLVFVRNSSMPASLVTFSQEEWDAFIKGAKEGEFDVRVQ